MPNPASPQPTPLSPGAVEALAVFDRAVKAFDQAAKAAERGNAAPDVLGFTEAYAVALPLFLEAGRMAEGFPPDPRLDCVRMGFVAVSIAAANPRGLVA